MCLDKKNAVKSLYTIIQENDAKHTDKAIKRLFIVKRLYNCDWLSQSPDLRLSCIPLADQTRPQQQTIEKNV